MLQRFASAMIGIVKSGSLLLTPETGFAIQRNQVYIQYHLIQLIMAPALIAIVLRWAFGRG
jgi:hypothetical protein